MQPAGWSPPCWPASLSQSSWCNGGLASRPTRPIRTSRHRTSRGSVVVIMSIKSEADWRGLRRAADVARETLDALERYVRAGITTGELDRLAAAIFSKRGARSAPALVYGFPGTVLISVNDEIVHGIPGEREIQPGDVVKLDVTVERDGYISDAARTVIAGSAADVASRLRDCAIAAFQAALGVARAGN